jgi:uncharacterized membrane protein
LPLGKILAAKTSSFFYIITALLYFFLFFWEEFTIAKTKQSQVFQKNRCGFEKEVY